jgi:hypothetical protein
VINGKCLMRGVNLRSLEVGDMLDVIHYLYEEDLIPLFEEHQKIKSQVRVQMWQSLYDSEYKHPYDEGAASSSAAGVNYGGPTTYKPGEMPPDESLLPDDDPTGKPLKPFVPATDPTDFMNILDAPLGDVPYDDD